MSHESTQPPTPISLSDILKRAHEVFPTREARHHFAYDGKAQKLLLVIFLDEDRAFVRFTLEDHELQKGVALIDEAVELLAADPQNRLTVTRLFPFWDNCKKGD